ncbi:MAG: AMP-binding protein [Ardenticatenaceae bacterium]
MEPQTLSQHFLQKVQQYPSNKVAVRQKEFGIWREWSWQDSYEQVKLFALGLIALGMEQGDRVATVGDNDRQYLWAYLGILSAGGVQVGLFTDTHPNEASYIVDHCDAVFVLAKDQEQCDKMLQIRDHIPYVKKVIYWDDRGLWNYEEPWLISFEEVQELGRELAAKEPDRLEKEIALGKTDDIAIFSYTSGTTGLPKGAILSHSNLVSASDIYQQIDPRYDTDNHVSFLPMGWIAEHVLGITGHVVSGIIINFPEAPETVRQNIRELAPQGLVYNSRLWDGLVGTVQVRINDATWLNRKLYEWFLPIGYQVADKRMTNEPIGLGLRMAYALGDWAVFAPIRDQLGLSRVRAAYTGGAALSPDAMRFFHALGINLKQVYGSTETAAGATVHRDGDIKFASVGQPAPGVDIKISEEGEILIAGPIVFQGYYKNEASTEKSFHIDEDGKRWFRTGDAGHVDEDGHLIYFERLKNVITLANGERFSPQFIEGRLKFSPNIRDVMAIGDPTRDFVTALIIIDFENVGKWAESNNIGYTTFTDLSQKKDVYDLIHQAVVQVNQNLPEAGRVRRFVLMHKEFDADDAEMTRSRKLKRGVLVDRYGDIIGAMYNGTDTAHVKASVRYKDGSEGVIDTNIHVMSA